MLSGRREGRGGLRGSDKERRREGGREREINYLSLNAKQRNQMSRGEGELHIVSPPFFHRSIVIMSKRGGNRRRRGTVRDYTDAELVSAAGGPLAGEGKLYAIDQWCFFSLGGVSDMCTHIYTHKGESAF